MKNTPTLSIKKVRDDEYDLIGHDGDPIINCIDLQEWEPIVRAVNAHEELVASIKEAVSSIENGAGIYAAATLRDALINTGEAIAKASKETR